MPVCRQAWLVQAESGGSGMLPSSPVDVHPWPVVLIGVTVVTVLAQPAQTTPSRPHQEEPSDHE